MAEPKLQDNVPLTLIQQIAERIDSGYKLTNRDLLAICGEAGIDALSTDPHLCHEIAETALNFLVATKYGKRFLQSDQPAVACRENSGHCRNDCRRSLGEARNRSFISNFRRRLG